MQPLNHPADRPGRHRKSISDTFAFAASRLHEDDHIANADLLGALLDDADGEDEFPDELLELFNDDDLDEDLSNVPAPSKPEAAGPTHKPHNISVDASAPSGSSGGAGLDPELLSSRFATQTRANALDPTQLDPKRAKRIIANRQSAHRSRMKKLQYMHDLEADIAVTNTATKSVQDEVLRLGATHTELVGNARATCTRIGELRAQVAAQEALAAILAKDRAHLKAITQELLAKKAARQQQQQQARQQLQQQQRGLHAHPSLAHGTQTNSPTNHNQLGHPPANHNPLMQGGGSVDMASVPASHQQGHALPGPSHHPHHPSGSAGQQQVGAAAGSRGSGGSSPPASSATLQMQGLHLATNSAPSAHHGGAGGLGPAAGGYPALGRVAPAALRLPAASSGAGSPPVNGSLLGPQPVRQGSLPLGRGQGSAGLQGAGLSGDSLPFDLALLPSGGSLPPVGEHSPSLLTSPLPSPSPHGRMTPGLGNLMRTESPMQLDRMSQLPGFGRDSMQTDRTGSHELGLGSEGGDVLSGGGTGGRAAHHVDGLQGVVMLPLGEGGAHGGDLELIGGSGDGLAGLVSPTLHDGLDALLPAPSGTADDLGLLMDS